jgi:hypothetical protein
LVVSAHDETKRAIATTVRHDSLKGRGDQVVAKAD